MVHPDNRLLLERSELSSHGKTLHAYYEVEEANLKGDALSDSDFMTFWKRQNSGDSKMISGGQALKGVGEGWAVKRRCVIL